MKLILCVGISIITAVIVTNLVIHSAKGNKEKATQYMIALIAFFAGVSLSCMLHLG